MKTIAATLLVLITFASALGAAEMREFDYFRPGERSQPLALPQYFSLSKFGKGLYRIDSFEVSHGQMNCIFLTFAATAPEGTTATREQAWKTEHIEIDGETVIRTSAVLLNPFPRAADPDGDVLVVRIDALSDKVTAELRAIVDGFLQK